MAKDLKDAALEAFKRSARSQETEPGDAESGSTEPEDAAPPPKRGRKPLRSTAAGTRRGPGSSAKSGPNAIGTATVTRRKAPTNAAAAVQAAQTRRPGPLGKRRKTGVSVAEKGTPGRGLQWTLIVINLVLLALVIVLLIRTRRLEQVAADHGKLIRQQAGALETIAKSADKARQNAQAKFGVFLDDKKKLHGVFVNYLKPSRCRVIELSNDAD
ncbi:MAG: hypothetical protein GXP31_05030 [Kiritimatiellaeota bacterium]|nr:hypothetical protein [Kiritimatiellota bacterium]